MHAATTASMVARRLAAARLMSTMPEGADINEIRQQLLRTALQLVPEYSFTDKTITEAAKLHEYPSTLRGLAPNGARDVIEVLFEDGIEHVRQAHAELLEQSGEKKPGMTKVVTHLSRARLEYMIPYIRQWPDAVQLLAHPTNVPFALHHLHKLVDEMWHLAGDKSFDTNYYSKRALLAGVYTSTELFMTKDQSPGFEQTWEFLNARFRDSAKVGKAASDVKTTLEWGASNLKGLLMSRGIRL
ncbi:rpsU-divergently transcribed protein [Allomyces macrogynus ATCC 38327]|uniref:Ubiquinone biosynthesis protein n=1 Tax=Allomyces macrogynus (strain ATCC 38327) TaxID=578462 RepID=A0A0L0S6F4_ALLM3|nr:rpsU-divergently transcribed protein [Allomyces macrogynus ATCC 38327]|eukprot:KNE57961.1 rpsU-divergently transcribed protein [Allomyces macrogynus ATCC 38327]